jgi:nucleotide-binding universal stress UspA family protein
MESNANGVLLPLDGSVASRLALAPARRLAEIFAVPLHILHVAATPVPERALASRLGLSADEIAGAQVEQTDEEPAATISRVARERDARIIVMSSQGERAWRARRLGSTTAAVIEHAPCPVLAVGADMPETQRSLRRLSRVLLPLDGSPGAAAVAALARDIASRVGARLDLLHIATSGLPLPAEPGTLLSPRYLDASHYELPAWAEEFLCRFCPGADGRERGDVELHAARGDPAEEIVRHARELDADLIAVAWHRTLAGGHAAIVKRLLGEAPAPILFVEAARDARAQAA